MKRAFALIVMLTLLLSALGAMAPDGAVAETLSRQTATPIPTPKPIDEAVNEGLAFFTEEVRDFFPLGNDLVVIAASGTYRCSPNCQREESVVGYTEFIEVNKAGTEAIMGTWNGVWAGLPWSLDNLTWIGNAKLESMITGAVWSGSTRYLAAGGDKHGGVLRSLDGGVWTLEAGIQEPIYGITILEGHIVAKGETDLFILTTTNDATGEPTSQEWQRRSVGLSDKTVIFDEDLAVCRNSHNHNTYIVRQLLKGVPTPESPPSFNRSVISEENGQLVNHPRGDFWPNSGTKVGNIYILATDDGVLMSRDGWSWNLLSGTNAWWVNKVREVNGRNLAGTKAGLKEFTF